MKDSNLNRTGKHNIYQGTKLTSAKTVNGKVLQPYLPDDQLKEAVNLAVFLQRPLLLMGDPGCGKTRLAEAVAYDIYGDDYLDYYFRWDVKSTSKARDGLYRYDALKRLRDAQLARFSRVEEEKGSKAAEKEIVREYIEEGPLGNAFKCSTEEKPAILLIDEIDKAEIDFPNDLLLEIDEGEYVIEETNEKITAPYPPIIFITSNKEKELPAPFLRRCLFHHIKFPKRERLLDIVHSHFDPTDDQLVKKAVDAFLLIRKTLEAKLTEADKKVSTGELLDWYKRIYHYYRKNIKIDNQEIDRTLDETIRQLHASGKGKIPFHQALLKNWASHISILIDAEDK